MKEEILRKKNEFKEKYDSIFKKKSIGVDMPLNQESAIKELAPLFEGNEDLYNLIERKNHYIIRIKK